ncbi:hypothetical protein [Nocardia amamiensis]|uniref:hypothetical protein n=1 Tax=Nocardia amamiensis TaxID=404578 RepID=UPI000ADC90AB|nr:hypothetical protein [Nocardia amamiensis]
MTETPPPAPKSAGGAPYPPDDDQRSAARPGQHESAAQYGTEPLEPPPVGAPHPSYGPPGTGPGWMPPAAAAAPQPVYGYQQVPAVPGTLDVGRALSFGWAKFRANPGPWAGVTAVGLIVYLAFLLVVQLTDPTTMLPLLLIFLAVMAAVWLLQSAMVRGALYETDGTPPPFGAYFRFLNAGNVLLTALLAFLLTFLGSAICLIPGLIAGWLCMFSLHFVVDQDQGPFEALKSSFSLVVANAWQVLLLALAVLVVTFLGLLLCGLGLLVAGPVATIAVTYAYRTLTGGTVAAL